MRFGEQFLLRLQVGCNLVRGLSLITYAPREGGGVSSLLYIAYYMQKKGGGGPDIM